MEKSVSYDVRSKLFLILMSLCAFFSIFAAFDTSEHYRAWRTAANWTDEQKRVAPAMDVDRMHPLIMAALAADTAIIAISFAGALALGIAVATESSSIFSFARLMGWGAVGLGLLYSILMIIYRMLVGVRVLLKGPIFDYNLHLQVPIAIAVAGFPLLFAYFAYRYRKLR